MFLAKFGEIILEAKRTNGRCAVRRIKAVRHSAIGTYDELEHCNCTGRHCQCSLEAAESTRRDRTGGARDIAPRSAKSIHKSELWSGSVADFPSAELSGIVGDCGS